MNKPFGTGRRSLQRFVRHQIQDRYVAGVTDAGKYRQFALRTHGAEGVVVKTTEICCGSSASDDDHGIKSLTVYLIQRRDDRGRSPFALHRSPEKR